MNMHLKISLLIAGAAILLSVTACGPSYIDPDISPTAVKNPLALTYVDLGTHKLAAFSAMKNSKYLVVCESGLGDGHSIWDTHNVSLDINDRMDVVTYDRANRGQSGNGPVPRDINRLQSELGAIIDAFAKGRKVILIGHSLGGFMIRDWAVKNPTRVAGLLFIDPSHEAAYVLASQTQIQGQEDAMYNQWNTAYGAGFGATLEAREWVEDLQYMATLGNLPDVPVIVITALKVDPPVTVADMQPWYDAHESLKKGVTDFTHVSTINSGHMVMVDEPKIILDNLYLLISKLPK